MKYIQRWSEGLLNQTKLQQKEGSDELPVDDKGFDSAVDKAQEKSGNISKADKKDKAELETMKKKFTTMLKSVLYSCICMNNIPEDIMNYIELVCSDSECEQIAKDFKIDVDELSDIISRMNDAEIMQINMLIYQLKCLLDDDKLKPIQRVSNAISKLGQLDKNEVVTGSDLVNKMLDKLGDRDMSGKSILEVNSKYGEFLIQIYERYGKEVANNVKIVASSDMTKNFIRKVLNILELDEQNLIELEDYNGNGIYDIKDFVEAPNEKILKYNNMKQWDVCLMNPPYGTSGGDDIHYRFTEKCVNMCDTTICVMPFALIKKNTGKNLEYKKVFNDTLVYAEELSGDIFNDTTQNNVGIYIFNQHNSNNITIKYITGEMYDYDNIPDDVFTTYESNIVDIFKKLNTQNIIWIGYLGHMDVYAKSRKIENNESAKIFRIKEYCKKLTNNKYYLVVNAFNGAMNATYYNNTTTGIIYNNIYDIEQMLCNRLVTNGYNFIVFNKEIEANNCKIALHNNVFRFILSKLQVDQSMVIKNCYQYIPNIDWSDPRVVTDEGLLEVCGCPKDKCKEYAEYCRKYMEKFDKQHQSKKKKVK